MITVLLLLNFSTEDALLGEIYLHLELICVGTREILLNLLWWFFKILRIYPTTQISSKSKYISPKRASSALRLNKSKTAAKQKQNLTLKILI